jgi:hypothetical protein
MYYSAEIYRKLQTLLNFECYQQTTTHWHTFTPVRGQLVPVTLSEFTNVRRERMKVETVINK